MFCPGWNGNKNEPLAPSAVVLFLYGKDYVGKTPFASDTATVMADDVLTVLGTPGPVKQLHVATESACWLQTCNGDAGESRSLG